jgi:hypothetical protein
MPAAGRERKTLPAQEMERIGAPRDTLVVACQKALLGNRSG